MEHVYSIITAVFSAAMFLYAGLMALTKDYKMIPYRSRQSVKPKDPKKYAFQLSKVLALVATAPAISALVGLLNVLVAVIVLFVGIIAAVWLGTKIMKNVE